MLLLAIFLIKPTRVSILYISGIRFSYRSGSTEHIFSLPCRSDVRWRVQSSQSHLKRAPISELEVTKKEKED